MHSEEQPNPIPTKLIPLSQWSEYHSYPSIATLRFWRFNSDKNGFNQCVLKVGKRVLIDEAKFFQWMKEYGQEGGE